MNRSGSPSGPGSGSPPLVLELRDVTVPGRGADRLAGVSLQLRAGERVALLGASGAGKSTLLAVANGLLQPSGGELFWEGAPPARSQRLRQRQRARIGTLWQDLRLIEELSVQQNLNAARLAEWGWPRALRNLLQPLETAANAAALRQVDLDPALLPQSVTALSGGQRQRLAIARLLRQQPTLLLADEPLAHLDPRLAAELLTLLLRQATAPRALLLSLHRPDLVSGFDRVLALRAGRLVLDAPPAALDAALIQSLYGAESMPALAEPR
ncbi:ATP-binding cassette domain-containing protein [Synechococcus sp. CS-1324]|uniref:ATP-binding cassette domain-containing protein n=1 Tax=Synechococcus sp. CS-1324 TaxID=2847980 RepID=UPI00223BB9AB|nr:ATP-binding cassette domain-containing protein [Synechococcus sp. CS-1324]MCT0229549.1 ATP-binding cassette domain-containing protein [Synechococcus sp. CS-1324]